MRRDHVSNLTDASIVASDINHQLPSLNCKVQCLLTCSDLIMG